jgi:hypothetical protein
VARLRAIVVGATGTLGSEVATLARAPTSQLWRDR